LEHLFPNCAVQNTTEAPAKDKGAEKSLCELQNAVCWQPYGCEGDSESSEVALFCHANFFLGAIWCDLVRFGANAAVFCGWGRDGDRSLGAAQKRFPVLPATFGARPLQNASEAARVD
jgi:hypothetical protein